jgi:serine protease Do
VGPVVFSTGFSTINTAINQSANNIGFAIPVNMVRDLLPRLLREGVIKRAAIGVQVGDVSLDDLERFKLPDRDGAIVARVIPRSPAATSGLQPGDVVVEFDGKPISSPEDLRWRASLADVGKEVTLVILRGGKKAKVSIRPAPLQGR